MTKIRTDLALESFGSGGKDSIPGVQVNHWEEMGVDITEVLVTDGHAARELGKPVGSDEKNEKTTYVTLHGLEASSCEVKRLSAEAAELAKKINGTEFLQELIIYLTVREN